MLLATASAPPRASHNPLVALFILTFLASLLTAPQALATRWQEGEIELVSLGEFLPRLVSDGSEIRCKLSTDLPIVIPWPEGARDARDLRIALTLNGYGIRQIDGAHELVRGPGGRRSAESSVRELAFVPMAPALGKDSVIESGGMIWCGRIVEPPFEISIAGERVQVNGLTVFPFDLSTTAPVVATQRAIDAHAVVTRTQARHVQAQRAKSAQDARLETMAFAMSHALVRDAEWVAPDRLRIRWDDQTSEDLLFDPAGRVPENPSPQEKRQALENVAASIRRELGLDATLLCGPGYWEFVLDEEAPALRNRVDQIVTSAESDDLQRARLFALLGHPLAAFDVQDMARGGDQ